MGQTPNRRRMTLAGILETAQREAHEKVEVWTGVLSVVRGLTIGYRVDVQGSHFGAGEALENTVSYLIFWSC